jgi:hypothetical protein
VELEEQTDEAERDLEGEELLRNGALVYIVQVEIVGEAQHDLAAVLPHLLPLQADVGKDTHHSEDLVYTLLVAEILALAEVGDGLLHHLVRPCRDYLGPRSLDVQMESSLVWQVKLGGGQGGRNW